MPFDATPQFDLDALCERDEVLRVLVEADRLLSGPEKWGRKGTNPGDDVRGRCVLGAISTAQGRTASSMCPEARALHAVLPEAWRPSALEPHSVVGFNNDPSTTFADVKTLFAKAITARARLVHEGAVLLKIPELTLNPLSTLEGALDSLELGSAWVEQFYEDGNPVIGRLTRGITIEINEHWAV